MKGIHLNKFIRGLDRDSPKRGYPNASYYDGKYIRLIESDDENDRGSVHTMEGNTGPVVYLDYNEVNTSISDHEVIGWGEVGDYTVLFSTQNTGDPGQFWSYSGSVTGQYSGDFYRVDVTFDGTTADDHISVNDDVELLGRDGIRYSVKVAGITVNVSTVEVKFRIGAKTQANKQIWQKFDAVAGGAFDTGLSTIMYAYRGNSDVIWRVNLSDNVPTLEAVYEGILTLSKEYPIYNEVVGYYMNEDVQKIYWTDTYNWVRSINVANPDTSNLSSGKLDVVPDVDMSRPYLYDVSGGSLPVGMVQYAYQLYRNDGSVTAFSTTSGLVHLTKSSENEVNDINYQGSDSLNEDGNPNNSGKSVTIKIEDIDTTYDYIRVVGLYYYQLYGEPEIKIVADTIAGSSNLIVTDDGGNYQGAISFNLFRSLGGTLFKAKALESKDNILFAGNIEESYFDIDELLGTGATAYWDARAYRWNDKREVKLYENVETTDQTNWTVEHSLTNPAGDTGAFFDGIGSTADVGNITNCPSRTTDVYIDNFSKDSGDTGPGVYVYQFDGSTVGGEGKNVKYEFVAADIKLKEKYASNKPYSFSDKWSSDTGDYEYTSYASTANPLVTSYYKGFKSDEIYSFGIKFFNAKKQQSFIKWIGDIRFPRIMDYPTALADYNGYSATVFYPLGIKFTVDTSDIPSEITHFQIVRCKRKAEDRTIITQSLTHHPFVYSNSSPTTIRPHWYPLAQIDTDWTHNGPLGDGIDKTVYICNSPDVFYGSSMESADWAVQVGRLGNPYLHTLLANGTWDSLNIVTQASSGSIDAVTSVEAYGFNSVIFKDYEAFTSSEPTNIANQETITPAQTSSDVIDIGATYNYANWYETRENGGYRYGPHCTSYIVRLSSAVSASIGGDDGMGLLVDLKKERIPYGGYTYYNRIQREYIPCSDVKQISGGDVSVTTYEGDTFVGMFEYLKNLFHDSTSALCTHVFYPVESSINPKLVERENSLTQNNDSIYRQVQENAGVYQFDDGVPYDNNTLTQNKDFYRYNTVYSKQDDSQVGYQKPDRTLYTENRSLIKASNPKSRYTIVDEWTNFASGNEKDLEAKYGPIEKLISIGNKLIFFQDNGFGTLDVNERALVQSTDDVQIALGGSGVLSRFDYISRNAGTQNRDTVKETMYGLFWYDNNRKRYWGYLDGLKDIGFEANMSSYFKGLSSYNDNIYTGNGIISGHNANRSEIFLTFYDGSYTTITFNYKLGAFTEFIDNEPVPYIENKGNLYDIKEDGDDSGNYAALFKYDGDTYQLYGNSFTPYITFIVAPMEFNRTFIRSAKYDVVSWLSEKYNSGSLVHGSTIDSIQFENDYQDSGIKTIKPYTSGVSNYNARKYNKVWRYNLIRDSNKNRMVDYYLKVTMKWSNNRFVLHEVTTHYRSAD